MDKNTLAGFGLLMVLLIAYIFYNQNAEIKHLEQRKADSIAQARLNPPKPIANTTDSTFAPLASMDSNRNTIAHQTVVIENEDIRIELSNYGAFPTSAQLKKYKTHLGKPLFLYKDGHSFDYAFNANDGRKIHSKDIAFDAQVSADQKSVTFTSNEIQFTYTIDDKGYMMRSQAKLLQASPNSDVQLQWTSRSLITEQDETSERLYTQVCYNLEKEGYDYFTIKDKETKKFSEAIKWLSFKQHYFNTTLITDNKIISDGSVTTAMAPADTTLLPLSDFDAKLTLIPASEYNFKFFHGPNDYALLKSYKIELEELIPLSYGIFGFVKYINKWIIIPIFDALSSIFSSYGIVILLLTFIIRLLMSPFTYKSYVSSAKMKALKPEIDELREKYGEDKQTFGVEQMKLYRQAGVNPLGGCLPALLQLPVFFALLSFFPHAIELRQESFLWAKDLSTYDSILDLPFTIPFYGDHVSLFTILFVITSLLLSLYSMNMTADQSNPMMKYLPFIMPVMFLGIFNKLPAALTYYYFVSNAITLALQFVIQNYIIDPDKIHAQIQAKKKEAPKESKFMKRMQEMQQQNAERMKKQQGKK